MSQMVEQMARLIANRLASGGAIYLPERGSLFVAFHGAKRISKRAVKPPFRSVEFTSEERGDALPKIIAQAAACDETTARTIYERWLAQTCQEDRLEIVGVGTLVQKHFTMADKFDQRLNPHGHAPLEVYQRRRFDWVLLIGILAIVVAAVAAGYYLMQKHESPVLQHGTQETPIHATDPAATPAPEMRSTDSLAVATETLPTASAQPAAAPSETQPASATLSKQPGADYSRLVPGHWYVVMGVFSTQENAERARKLFGEQQPNWSLTIHPFGSRYMLTCYVAASESGARGFLQTHREAFPDLWVHAAR